MKDTVKRFNSSLKAMVSYVPCTDYNMQRSYIDTHTYSHTHSSITFQSLLHQSEEKETHLLATNVKMCPPISSMA